MPGRGFTSPGDFNTRFSGWLVLGNARVVRTLKARPVDLLAADRAAMLALPPVPLHLGWHQRIRLGRDYYVREPRRRLVGSCQPHAVAAVRDQSCALVAGQAAAIV
jgi:hypothetical protein